MQLKKTLLASAALLSAGLWAPSAHAIPAFARQVGMACSACHYQHFPVLNGFGRAFKLGGFTMMGSEDKVEGDGLSIPSTLNLAFITNLAYAKTNGPNAASATTKTTNNGQFQMTQYSLFMGGRVGEHIGFEGEVGLSGGAALNSVKLPFAYDVTDTVKALVVPFTTNGLGAQQGFEPLSTGASPVHLFNQQDMNAISAPTYLGTATPAYGVALVGATDLGFVNFTKWAPDSINGNNPGAAPGAPSAGSPSANYLRLAVTPGNLIPGFDFAAGIQSWSGTGATTGLSGGAAAGVYDTKATSIDGQLMGDVSGMPLTFIASYATAPASPVAGTGNANLFNAGTATRKSFNLGAELGVIPNKATLQLGLRRASAGVVVPGTAVGNATDNAIMVGATYAIAMNVRAELTYSKYSGDMYNSAAQLAAGYAGNQLTVLNLWMGF